MFDDLLHEIAFLEISKCSEKNSVAAALREKEKKRKKERKKVESIRRCNPITLLPLIFFEATFFSFPF